MSWPLRVLGLPLVLGIYEKLLAERTGDALPGQAGSPPQSTENPPDAPERAARPPDGAKSPDQAVARQTDPETSWAAADSLGDLTERQRPVLDLFRRWGPHGATDEEMVRAYHLQERSLGRPPQTDSGLRTRRSELARRGHLEQAGHGTTRSGRSALRWRASEPRANLPPEENA